MTNSNEIEVHILTPNDFVIVVDVPDDIDLTMLASRNYDQFESEVLRLTNIRREEEGIQPVKHNEYLARSSLAHTLDMAENHFISHTGTGNTDLAVRVRRAGYVNWIAIGENLAMGQRTPEEVVEAWMQSPGHRKNLLSPAFFEIGVAFIEGDIIAGDGRVWRGGYWAQNFGARLTAEHMTAKLKNRLGELFTKPNRKDNEEIGIDILVG